MKNTEPESSFQSPDDYKEYGEASTAAMMVYQRVRRPLMFHILLVLVFCVTRTTFETGVPVYDEEGKYTHYVLEEYEPSLSDWISVNATVYFLYLLWVIPILGIVSYFRRLEDGFQADDEDEPVFTLKVEWGRLGTATSIFQAPYIERLKREWFWRTWMFYPTLLIAPLAAVWAVFTRGLGLFMDIFFLRCWDKWYYAINTEALAEKNKKRIIDGPRLIELGKTAGSAPINFIKNKLGKRDLEKDLTKKKENEK